jgi:2-dehydro-3-deoxyphosphogalactonate aldolase
MPHNDRAIIQASRDAGLEVLPGVATPNEAFATIVAGPALLKFFPAEHLGPASLNAWRAVLPSEVGLVPVGGIRLDNIEEFINSGAAGFGLGSALYRTGLPTDAVVHRARSFAKVWAAARCSC